MKTRQEVINEIQKVQFFAGIDPETIDAIHNRSDEELQVLRSFLCTNKDSKYIQQTGAKRYGKTTSQFSNKK